ncbi:hypothetical protein IQ07DRAFT_652519 [Pyrenochaeta sp. DS3sAY3a]|nr:hypothetical protein IQ07DRAFT_652519 [Pyrenochaeta sp. DS3sAY3a]
MSGDASPGSKRSASDDFESPSPAKRIKNPETNEKKIFRFLELPAELRNEIYSYCQTEPVVNRTKREPQECPSVPKTGFHALTQINHELRNEFLPLYHRNIRHYVDFHYIERYAETFLQHPETVSGTIHLILALPRDSGTYDFSVDVAQFLRLCKKHKGLVVQLWHHGWQFGVKRTSWKHGHGTLLQFIHLTCDESIYAHKARWTTYFDKAVVRLVIHFKWQVSNWRPIGYDTTMDI